MKFDPLPEIIAEESLFESGLLLAGAVAPAVVRRHVPEHTVWRPVHYLVRMSRSTHVLLTSRFETLSLAVGVAMTQSIDLSTDGKAACSSPVPSLPRLCAAMYLSTPFGGRSITWYGCQGQPMFS